MAIYQQKSVHPRRGLNRVEVVLLLLGALLLVGVMLPALQLGRESATRVQCANNIRQLGAAVHKYKDATNFLPPAGVGERHATWAVLLAPYALKDSAHALNGWDVALPFALQTDRAREAQVALFYCPARKREFFTSIADEQPTHGQPEVVHYPGALGDYACVAGDGDTLKPWDGPHANGPFVVADVLKKDGERVLTWRPRIQFDDLKRGGPTLLLGDKHVPTAGRGTAAVGDGALYDGGHPANFSRVGGPGFALAESDLAPWHRNFGSQHAGVVQFVAADGSLSTFTPEVSPVLLGKLMIRDLE